MGLFSFKKKKPPEGFAFLVEEVFSLREGGGVVTAGRVTEGVLPRGARAVCVPTAGENFLCAVEAIEQPDPGKKGRFLHPEEARADGPCGGRYALFIPGRHPSDFRPGDRLLPIGSVPLDEPEVMTPKPCKGFLFEIREIFSIRNVGVAVAGIVLNGSAAVGDTVSFGHAPGTAVFSCAVKAIHGKGSPEDRIAPVDRATADGPCRLGCSLVLDETEPRRFRVGEYLFIL